MMYTFKNCSWFDIDQKPRLFHDILIQSGFTCKNANFNIVAISLSEYNQSAVIRS